MRIPPGLRAALKTPAALLIAVAGVVVAWPAGLLPGVMVPIPESVNVLGSGPLLKLTTSGSVYLLQTMGFAAAVDGGFLRIDQTSVDLAQASGGLRVLIAALAVSTAVGVLARKPLWERVLLAISGLPVGIVCGAVRVTAGAALLEWVSEGLGGLVLYGAAGWVTMGLALGFLMGERWLLSRLLIAPPARDVVPIMSERQLPAEEGPDLGMPSPAGTATAPASREPEPVSVPLAPLQTAGVCEQADDAETQAHDLEIQLEEKLPDEGFTAVSNGAAEYQDSHSKPALTGAGS